MPKIAQTDASGSPLIGTVMTLPGVITAELVAETLDVVWIDLEHAALGMDTVAEMILGVQAADCLAFVRLPSDDFGRMKISLDAGADGVVLADVRTAATVQIALRHMAHPPTGERGWGPRRLSTKNRHLDPRTAKPQLWVQIESAAGVEAAHDIASVDGVDMVVIGSADLSFNLGVPLQMTSPVLLDAIDAVRAAVATTDARFGLAGPVDGLSPSALRGAEALVHSTDARLLAGAMDSMAVSMRARAQSAAV